jgi:hypothetical protein
VALKELMKWSVSRKTCVNGQWIIDNGMLRWKLAVVMAL